MRVIPPKTMNIPRWKQKEMENEKTTSKDSTQTVSGGVASADQGAAVTATTSYEAGPIESEANVFKKPQQPVAKKNVPQNRDPRMTRSVVHSAGQDNERLQMTIQNDPKPSQVMAPRSTNIKNRLGWNNNNRPTLASNSTGRSLPKLKSRGTGITRTAIFVAPTEVVKPTLTPTQTPVSVVQNAPSTSVVEEANQEQSPQIPVSPESQSPQGTPFEPPQQALFSLPTFAALTTKNVSQMTLPSFATGPQQYEPPFTYLFKKVCRLYMHDACDNPNECGLEHICPNPRYTRSLLNKMYQKSVIDLYDNYMRRNIKLFNFYFEMFSDYFADKNLIDKLKQMVEDCNERKVQYHFSQIVDSLCKTGKSYTDALGDVINAVIHRSLGASREIVKLIVHTRNENIVPFIDCLYSIANTAKFKFRPEWINHLLLIHNEKKIVGLAKVIYVIIDENSINTNVDTELLNAFNELNPQK